MGGEWKAGEEFLAIMARKSDEEFWKVVAARNGQLWIYQGERWISFSGGTDRTPPPAAMGAEGMVFDATTNRYHDGLSSYEKSIKDYHREVKTKYGDTLREVDTVDDKTLPSEPGIANQPIQLKTGQLEAESIILGKEAGSVKLNEDTTHEYLLWSVPQHTGKHLAANLALPLETVSGEAAAEVAAEGKDGKSQGYMMKQTLEHLEALTALLMMQGDEKLKPGDIVSQYGSAAGPFDTSKVDPLHHPRDPIPHLWFTEVLKKIEACFKDGPATEAALESAMADVFKSKGGAPPALITEIAKLANELPPDLTADERLVLFKKRFYGPFGDKLLVEISKIAPTFQAGDDYQEVTRAAVKDGDGQLVGARQAQFDSIWGPKSAEVMEKAAQRRDGLRSHGWLYHDNPQKTVQATEEFPTYRRMMEEFAKAEPDVQVRQLYEDVVEDMGKIITLVGSLAPKKDGMSHADMASARKVTIDQINELCNHAACATVKLRGALTTK